MKEPPSPLRGRRISPRPPGSNNFVVHPTSKDFVDSVNVASEAAHKSWLIFLTLATYLVVAIAGITHLDILFDTATNLPLINIRVPLAGFYVVSPAIILAAHFSLLLQHEILLQKICELRAKIVGVPSDEASAIWICVHYHFFTQAFSHANSRKSISVALRWTIVSSLMLLPPLLLVYFQITFLPAHSLTITWWHRACLLADVVLVVFFARALWRAIEMAQRRLRSGQVGLQKSIAAVVRRLPTRRGQYVVMSILRGRRRYVSALHVVLVTICLFSVVIATIPDESIDRLARRLWPARVDDPNDLVSRQRKRIVFYPTAIVFERKRDPRGGGLGPIGWSRNLILVDTVLNGRDLRNRDMRYAVFLNVQLEGADFRGSDLTGARFALSKGPNSLFDNSILRGSLFFGSEFQGAKFRKTHLERAISWRSNFDGASFREAKLTISEMTESSLDGADFSDASLETSFFYDSKA